MLSSLVALLETLIGTLRIVARGVYDPYVTSVFTNKPAPASVAWMRWLGVRRPALPAAYASIFSTHSQPNAPVVDTVGSHIRCCLLLLLLQVGQLSAEDEEHRELFRRNVSVAHGLGPTDAGAPHHQAVTIIFHTANPHARALALAVLSSALWPWQSA